MPFLPLTGQGQPGHFLHYQDVGRGQPVVLLHDWPMGLRMWEMQQLLLAEAGFRVISYDQRGFGAASQPWEGYDYDQLAHDLHTLLQTLGLQRCVVMACGWSVGVLLRYAQRYGTQCMASAVMLSTPAPRIAQTSRPQRIAKPAPLASLIDTRQLRMQRLEVVQHWVQHCLSDAQGRLLVSDAQLQYWQQIAAFAFPKATVESWRQWHKVDGSAFWQGWDVPMLVVHGGSDAVLPWERSGWEGHFFPPHSRALCLDGAPHWLCCSHAQPLHAAMLEFLQAAA